MRISKKYGVNPSLEICYLCGGSKGVILFGRIPGDEKAPREACLNKEPCEKCREYMKMGVILIGVREKDPDYRTGVFMVVSDGFVTRCFGDHAKDVLKSRVAFVSDEALKKLGLVDGDGKPVVLTEPQGENNSDVK